MAQGNTSLSRFLAEHITKDKNNITHTRIGDRTCNIPGGCYHIPDDELLKFYELYYNNVLN